MRKFISKSYLCLIYVFFALFALIIRMDANENTLIYSIGLMIAALFLAIIPFFTNHCKRIEFRRMYLITMILLSLCVFINAISYLLANEIASNDTLMAISTWVIRLSQALFITSTLFTIFYGIKDYFKKGYELQKFDLHAIQMIFNLLTYIAFIYLLLDFGKPAIHLSLGGYQGGVNEYYITFENFNVIRNAIFIISGCYIAIYALLEIIKYKKFEKIEDNSNNIYK